MNKHRRPAKLRGNPFVGTFFEVTNPKDGAFGEPATPRTCTYCFYHSAAKNDCQCGAQAEIARQSFGIQLEKKMPTTIGGLQVGNYCPHWAHYGIE